jgi:hypothetical protein
MTAHPDRRADPSTAHEVEIVVDGRVVAVAKVSRTADPAVVRSAMHVESGQLPRGARARLVDAVLDDPEIRGASHLCASMPIGDTDMLDRVRERAGPVQLRAAGATKLVEVDLPAATAHPPRASGAVARHLGAPGPPDDDAPAGTTGRGILT